jgi:hypothetical protein
MSETLNKLINDDYTFSESDLLIDIFTIGKEEIDVIMDIYKICCLNYNEDCEFIKCSNCCLLGMFGLCVYVKDENTAYIFIRKLSRYVNILSKGIIQDTIHYINHEVLHGVICHIGEKDAGKKYDLVRTHEDATFDYCKAFELEKRLLTNNGSM